MVHIHYNYQSVNYVQTLDRYLLSDLCGTQIKYVGIYKVL
jgi:hypothetical protein